MLDFVAQGEKMSVREFLEIMYVRKMIANIAFREEVMRTSKVTLP
jgi:hypothetical protein